MRKSGFSLKSPIPLFFFQAMPCSNQNTLSFFLVPVLRAIFWFVARDFSLKILLVEGEKTGLECAGVKIVGAGCGLQKPFVFFSFFSSIFFFFLFFRPHPTKFLFSPIFTPNCTTFLFPSFLHFSSIFFDHILE